MTMQMFYAAQKVPQNNTGDWLRISYKSVEKDFDLAEDAKIYTEKMKFRFKYLHLNTFKYLFTFDVCLVICLH